MNKILTNAFFFTIGAAAGSLVMYKVVKTKYEQIIQAEIDAFKNDYMRCMNGNSNADISNSMDEEDQGYEGEDGDDITEYQNLAKLYNNAGNDTENDGEGAGDGEVPYINGPYVIDPDEFANGDFDHDLYSLTYYADGVLANDWYDELDIEETIGEEALEHFGDHVEDVVHVRNEREKADYEVVRDCRNFADIIANDPLGQAYAN